MAGVTNTDSGRYGHWADTIWADTIWADTIWADAGGVMPQLDRGVGTMEFLADRETAL